MALKCRQNNIREPPARERVEPEQPRVALVAQQGRAQRALAAPQVQVRPVQAAPEVLQVQVARPLEEPLPAAQQVQVEVPQAELLVRAAPVERAEPVGLPGVQPVVLAGRLVEPVGQLAGLVVELAAGDDNLR